MTSFEELCRENYGRVYKYIYAMTGDKETAEDLLQDVFTVAFTKGEGFLRHENPPAFLYRTARNLTLTYLKRRRLFPEEALREDVADGNIDLFDRISRDSDRRIDETAYTGLVFGRLSGKERALYERRYIDRKSILAIAAEQGVSEPAMRMRLVRLRQEIRKFVRELKLEEK